MNEVLCSLRTVKSFQENVERGRGKIRECKRNLALKKDVSIAFRYIVCFGHDREGGGTIYFLN